jgi:hypothetical protein
MLYRANFVTSAIAATRTLPSASDAVLRHLDGVMGPRTAAELGAARDDRQRWFTVLASPEFQLK